MREKSDVFFPFDGVQPTERHLVTISGFNDELSIGLDTHGRLHHAPPDIVGIQYERFSLQVQSRKEVRETPFILAEEVDIR